MPSRSLGTRGRVRLVIGPAARRGEARGGLKVRIVLGGEDGARVVASAGAAHWVRGTVGGNGRRRRAVERCVVAGAGKGGEPI